MEHQFRCFKNLGTPISVFQNAKIGVPKSISVFRFRAVPEQRNSALCCAHCTSKTRARFSSVAFAIYLRSVGAAPARPLRGRHWGVPTKACDHGPPQARLLGVCACFVVKKGRAFCIALCSLDAPETRNLSWHGRVPNEAAFFALCSP